LSLAPPVAVKNGREKSSQRQTEEKIMCDNFENGFGKVYSCHADMGLLVSAKNEEQAREKVSKLYDLIFEQARKIVLENGGIEVVSEDVPGYGDDPSPYEVELLGDYGNNE
jgi:hypothetical protein